MEGLSISQYQSEMSAVSPERVPQQESAIRSSRSEARAWQCLRTGPPVVPTGSIHLGFCKPNLVNARSTASALGTWALHRGVAALTPVQAKPGFHIQASLEEARDLCAGRQGTTGAWPESRQAFSFSHLL